MKKVLFYVMFTGLFTMFTFGQKKETRTVSGFTEIDASSAFEITVSKGSTESLIIEADEAIMSKVRSEVRNGVLHLYLDDERKVKNVKTLKASVVMKNLDKVSLSGACKLTANDQFTPDRFKGNCSGASSLTLNVNTGELSIDASGVSKIQMKANVTGDAKLDVSGTSKVQADDFVVKTATIESSGTSKVTVNVAETLNANSSGASTIEYKGSPAIQANTGGASKIRKI